MNISNIKKIIIVLLSLIGFTITIELFNVYFQANFNPNSAPSFCAINNFMDCDAVAKTSHSQFLGIPLALWGMFLYIFVLFMSLVDKLKEFRFLRFLEVFKNPYSYIYCLTLLSFIISMYLAGVSFFQIGKVCILCFVTYFINLFIALFSRSWGSGFGYDIKTSIKDFVEAVSVKKYALAFIILTMLAIGTLTFTATSYILAPQTKSVESLKRFKNINLNFTQSSDNTLGDPDAKIIIKSFTDYNCQGCYIVNLMLERAVSELKGVKVIHYHLPLDSECNSSIKQKGHTGSCLMARYAMAAENQNKFWKMNDTLFEKTPKTEEEILDIAKKLKLDTKKLQEDANSEEVLERIKDQIDYAQNSNVEGTPTIFIGMHRYLGPIPYYELKEKLIKAGATERK